MFGGDLFSQFFFHLHFFIELTITDYIWLFLTYFLNYFIGWHLEKKIIQEYTLIHVQMKWIEVHKVIYIWITFWTLKDYEVFNRQSRQSLNLQYVYGRSDEKTHFAHVFKAKIGMQNDKC